MKGYKATYNYKCLDQDYEIGQTYELDGRPILCFKGFHFCPNMGDVLNYYGYIPNDFKLLEIEAVGDVVTEEDKSCTNKIKIIREVPMEEWDFCNILPKGHYEIHYKGFDGYEEWKEYDENGNEVYFKDSYGYEYWYEYDKGGNVTHYKNSYEHEFWKEYDEKGNMIHHKDSYGFECWYEYDESGRVIHYKDSAGGEYWNQWN